MTIPTRLQVSLGWLFVLLDTILLGIVVATLEHVEADEARPPTQGPIPPHNPNAGMKTLLLVASVVIVIARTSSALYIMWLHVRNRNPRHQPSPSILWSAFLGLLFPLSYSLAWIIVLSSLSVYTIEEGAAVRNNSSTGTFVAFSLLVCLHLGFSIVVEVGCFAFHTDRYRIGGGTARPLESPSSSLRPVSDFLN